MQKFSKSFGVAVFIGLLNVAAPSAHAWDMSKFRQQMNAVWEKVNSDANQAAQAKAQTPPKPTKQPKADIQSSLTGEGMSCVNRAQELAARERDAELEYKEGLKIAAPLPKYNRKDPDQAAEFDAVASRASKIINSAKEKQARNLNEREQLESQCSSTFAQIKSKEIRDDLASSYTSALSNGSPAKAGGGY